MAKAHAGLLDGEFDAADAQLRVNAFASNSQTGRVAFFTRSADEVEPDEWRWEVTYVTPDALRVFARDLLRVANEAERVPQPTETLADYS